MTWSTPAGLRGAILESPAVERAYRDRFLREDARTASAFLVIAAVSYGLFGRSDFRFATTPQVLAVVLSARAAFVGFCAVGVWSLLRTRRPAVLDWWAVAWALALALRMVHAQSIRPADHFIPALADLGVAMSLWLIFPARFLFQVAAVGLVSAGCLTWLLLFRVSPPHDGWALIVSTWVAANVIGAYGAWRGHRQRRAGYLDLLRLAAAEEAAMERGAALASKEQEQRELLEHLQAGVVVHAPDASVVQANRMAGVMLGVTPDQPLDELAAAPGWRFLHEDGTAMLAEEYPVSRVLATNAPVVEQVVGIDRPGSRERGWAVVNAYPEHDGVGAVRRVVVTFIGITGRKQVEERLRLSEERHRLLAENARDVIWTMSLDGRITYVSPSVEQLRGFTVAEAMRQTTEEILTPDSQAVSLGYYQKLFAGLQAGRLPQGFRGELEYKCKDGSTRWTETIALPVFGPDGAVVEMLGVSRDLDERKRGEAALSAQRDEIEALNRSLEVRVDQAVAEIRTKDQLLIAQNRHAAMGQMIGNIAHQWRQPLNALTLVLANLEDAARFGDLDAATLTEAVDDSNQLIQKMSATIDDFRNFFRPEKKRVVFSAISQVRGTLALLEASFRNTGITVEVDAPSDVSLFGLPNEYSQVLMNLFTNARQAIEGAKVANGRMTVRLRERDGFGAVTVSDDGGGIPEALLLRLGEPYFTTKDGGTGLGIYMSRQIVELSMGGRLEVRNVDGGAEFTVLSPLAGSVSVVSTSRRQ